MPPHEEGWAGAALAAAGTLQCLDPGPLAECRRMDERDGAPVFWRLAARHPETIGHRSRMEQWVTIVRILAILTPKGDPAARYPLHDSNRRLGAVLCDGGDLVWPGASSGSPSPAFSERRLAQLMAARGSQRAVLLERAARSLARSRSPNTGVNVVDIAAVLIQPENGRLLAEPYYHRLDQIETGCEDTRRRSLLMPEPRFLQIHTLSPYTAALLNRDDSGLAKRLPYGGILRTRISSQCLKRHWRIAEDIHSLSAIDGATAACRSRELVTRKIVPRARELLSEDTASSPAVEGSGAVFDALAPWFQYVMYSGKTENAPKKLGEPVKADKKEERQTLIFGAPELEWLAGEYARLVREADGVPEKAFRLGREWAGDSKTEAAKAFKANIGAMREKASLPHGLVTALFGRMVTSDPAANITAPVHVAHAFTVHAEESESDYFTAVDDLSGDEPGADTIQETELTSGLFYGYVVVDLPGLIENLGGDTTLAGQVLHNLIYLIAEVSPGAKPGSTAPYGRASFMLLEAGDRQPRSLAEAYRDPCKPHVGPAVEALSSHLAALDEAYATGEARRVMSLVKLEDTRLPGAARGSLADLAGWAETLAGASQS